MIKLIQGDITTQSVDAIVNAANSGLLGGGGVDGAIHRAGGPKILEECKVIRQTQGSCAPGHAVITSAGKLKATYIIHAVGPIWRGGAANEEETLAMAYTNSLNLALQYEVKTVSFPSISTGAYGFPLDLAAPIAISTISQFINNHRLPETAYMVLFDSVTFAAYEKAFGKYHKVKV